MTHARRHPGFSLIELVTVLVILGVLAMLVAPRYAQAQDRYRVTASAQRLKAALDLARDTARAASTSHTVNFSLAQQTCTLVGIEDPDTRAPDTVLRFGDELAASLSAANFNASTGLTFDGYGRPSHGGGVTLAAGERSIVVAVEAQTGRVTVGGLQ